MAALQVAGLLLLSVAVQQGLSKVDKGKCAPPPTPANGRSACDYHAGVLHCVGECDPNYVFSTSFSKVDLECHLTDGSWKNALSSYPDCVPIPESSSQVCSKPREPADGTVSCNQRGRTLMCEYSCDPGFQLEADAPYMFICNERGWAPPLKEPTCIPGGGDGHSLMPKPSGSGGIGWSSGPKGVCQAWSQENYRTFDGRVYQFSGRCSYVLAKDCAHNTFSIVVNNDRLCGGTHRCSPEVEIFLEGALAITLKRTAEGAAILQSGAELLPGRYGNLYIHELSSSYLIESLDYGFKLMWDGYDGIDVEVSSKVFGRTCGLCGVYDDKPGNDFTTLEGRVSRTAYQFAKSWTNTLLTKDACPDVLYEDSNPCSGGSADSLELSKKVDDFCQQIVTLGGSKCSGIDHTEYVKTCKVAYCTRNREAACKTFEKYFNMCQQGSTAVQWRSEKICPMDCSSKPGSIYSACAPLCTPTCKNPTCDLMGCQEACACPPGSVLDAGRCIRKDECSCFDKSGKEIFPDETVNQGCKTCTCTAGELKCDDSSCASQCYSIGDPHLKTLDGTKYDFHGHCQYTMAQAKDNSFHLMVKNDPCGRHGNAACTTAMTLVIAGHRLELIKNKEIFLDHVKIPSSSLPYVFPEGKILSQSSIFVEVDLNNGVRVLWDGVNRAYVMIPAVYKEKVRGLCGSFDDNKTNDFETPTGDIVTNPNVFGNSYKVDPKCPEVPPDDKIPNPCDTDPAQNALAKTECEKLGGPIFSACHSTVDPKDYIENCKLDVCNCVDALEECLCQTLGAYADVCANLGVSLPWRQSVDTCQLTCPPGQVYNPCVSTCKSKCSNLALSANCTETCFEGCTCPDGQVLDKNDQCVYKDDCPCVFDGREYPPGYQALQGNKECYCEAGLFQCYEVPTGSAPDPSFTPVCPPNMEFTSCKPSCPGCGDPSGSCNPVLPCQSGCTCSQGFVMNRGSCVPTPQCPCVHNGKDYQDGETIVQDCHTMKCVATKWVQQDTKICPGKCTTSGESHYKTFDGQLYDFKGDCEYILVKSTATNSHKFAVKIVNVPCAQNTAVCSKAIVVSVGDPSATDGSYKEIQLRQGQPVVVPSGGSITVRDLGGSVLVTTNFGLQILWDKATRVYAEVSEDHVLKVEGLCGDFDGKKNDISQNGSPVSPQAFADRWKVDKTCAPATSVPDNCALSPYKKPWANQQCSVISSPLFRACHSLVDPTPYVNTCLQQACACDDISACPPLCTAIAAYAHECNVLQVQVNWRSNILCPIRCDPDEEFSSCISTCPIKTCANKDIFAGVTSGCNQQVCAEGCQPKPCPAGQVYDSSAKPHACVPETTCAPSMCQIDGRMYPTGMLISDPTLCGVCENCWCQDDTVHRTSKVNCKVNTPPPIGPGPSGGIPTPPPNGPGFGSPQYPCVKSGWTPWMNSFLRSPFSSGDFETLGSLRAKFAFCSPQQITTIECREVQSGSTQLTQKVTCDRSSGLACQDSANGSPGSCKDYEVRFYCLCAPGTVAGVNPTLPGQLPTTQLPSLNNGPSGVTGNNPTPNGPGPIGGKPTPGPINGPSGVTGNNPTPNGPGPIGGRPTPGPNGGPSGVIGNNPTPNGPGPIGGQPTPGPIGGPSGVTGNNPTPNGPGPIGGQPTPGTINGPSGVTGNNPTPNGPGPIAGRPTPGPNGGPSGVTGNNPTPNGPGPIGGQPTPGPINGPSGVTGNNPTPNGPGPIGGQPTPGPINGPSGVTGNNPTPNGPGPIGGQPTPGPNGGPSGLTGNNPTPNGPGPIGGQPTPGPNNGPSGVTGNNPTPNGPGPIGGRPTPGPNGGPSGVTGNNPTPNGPGPIGGQPTPGPNGGPSGVTGNNPTPNGPGPIGGRPTPGPNGGPSGVTGNNPTPHGPGPNGRWPTLSPKADECEISHPNGTVQSYSVGESWTDADPCLQYRCESKGSSSPSVVTTVTQCQTQCGQNMKYVPSADKAVCCGRCEPKSVCQDSTGVYTIGDPIPTGSPCRRKVCALVSGLPKIIESHTACPVVTRTCNKNEPSMDQSGCCQVCVPASSSTCASCSAKATLNATSTVGIFMFTGPGNDVCVNEAPVSDVKECSGYCGETKTMYSVTGVQKACSCCKAQRLINKSVPLKCASGRTVIKVFPIPASCACMLCS